MNELKDKQKEIKTYENEFKRLNQKISDYEKEAKNLNATIEALEKDNAKLNATISDLQAEIKELNREITKLNQELDEYDHRWKSSKKCSEERFMIEAFEPKYKGYKWKNTADLFCQLYKNYQIRVDKPLKLEMVTQVRITDELTELQRKYDKLSKEYEKLRLNPASNTSTYKGVKKNEKGEEVKIDEEYIIKTYKSNKGDKDSKEVTKRSVSNLTETKPSGNYRKNYGSLERKEVIETTTTTVTKSSVNTGTGGSAYRRRRYGNN